MEYYIDFFSNYNNSYIFMAMLTTFFNFSFFLLNQNDKKYPLDTYDSNSLDDTPIGEVAPEGGGSDLEDLSEVASGSDPYSGSSSDGETSDLDYEPSFKESGYETSSVSISEGDSVTQASSDRSSTNAYDAEGADPDYKKSTDSEGGDSLTSSLCCPCFINTSPKAPSESYLGESQLSDLYSNSSFYSIDSEDEDKIKKIKLKMRSLKLKIKNIKLSALNKSNLSTLLNKNKSNLSTLINN